MSKCRRCHREIKNPKSVQQGYGPICWTKIQKSNDSCLEHLDCTDANGEPQIWTTAHNRTVII